MYVTFTLFINNMKITPGQWRNKFFFLFFCPRRDLFPVNSAPVCSCSVFCNKKITWFSNSDATVVIHIYLYLILSSVTGVRLKPTLPPPLLVCFSTDYSTNGNVNLCASW